MRCPACRALTPPNLKTDYTCPKCGAKAKALEPAYIQGQGYVTPMQWDVTGAVLPPQPVYPVAPDPVALKRAERAFVEMDTVAAEPCECGLPNVRRKYQRPAKKPGCGTCPDAMRCIPCEVRATKAAHAASPY